MGEYENRERIIEWDDTHFFIVNSSTLRVLHQDNAFGWLDQEGWEEAMLDGPIADLRRVQEKWTGYNFGEPVDMVRAIEKMLYASRAMFVGPLTQLEAYARHYQHDQNDEPLL